uniref:2EXR domain-containing protein n=1 Tax=Psilocybe cubensis TaxID=181762 RepID=A0A8H7XS77_PSICU
MDRTLRATYRMTRLLTPPEPVHSLIASLTGDITPQVACLLFTSLPPEIRHRIFSFALQSYDDTSRPYPDNSYYSRPGYRYHQRINIALLAVCRRIYTETHALAVRVNEHVFWCSSMRGPPRAFFDNPKWYFSKFTVEQRAAISHIHLFTQMYWVERAQSFRDFCELEDVHPKQLTITIRHTDWWFWELNTPLAMKLHWLEYLQPMKKLTTLVMELETIERDHDQLDAVIENVLNTCLVIRAGSRTLNIQKDGLTTVPYVGPAIYKYDWDSDLEESIYYSKQDDRWITGKTETDPGPIPYVLSTIRWIANTST